MMRQNHIAGDLRRFNQTMASMNGHINMKKSTTGSSITNNVINLSRLSMSKGKFSLSSKYNSHNNNQSNFNSKKQQQTHNHYHKIKQPQFQYQSSNIHSMDNDDYCQTKRYLSDQQKHKLNNNRTGNNIMSQMDSSQVNKQNISIYANTDKTLSISTKSTLFKNHHQQQQLIYASQNSKYQQYCQNNVDDNDEQQRIYQIRDIANNIMQQHPLKNQHSLKKQQHHMKKYGNKNNIIKQKENPMTNTNNSQTRRSKFHKYDNSKQHNQFLFIQQTQQQQQDSTCRQQQMTQIITELKSSLQSKDHQLQQYKHSIKQISYSMIMMISLMSKFQKLTNSGQQIKDHEYIQCIRLLRKEISQIYTKQLVHYIDKLHIRQELVELAQREAQKNRVANNNRYHSKDNGDSQEISLIKKEMVQNVNDCTFVHDDSKVNDDNSVQKSNQQQSHNTYSQQSIIKDDDSLQNYQLRSVNHHNYHHSHHHTGQHNHNQNPSLSQSSNHGTTMHQQHYENESQFDFNKIDQLQLQLVHSGRNLLETFNHEHLKEQLNQINNNSNDDQDNSVVGEESSQHNSLSQQKIISSSKQQLFAQNLQYALLKGCNSDLFSQHSISISNNASNQQVNVCRKLFEENDSKQQTNSISMINSSKPATNNQIKFQNNDNGMRLKQEHCYKLIKPINYQEELTTSNYLKLELGSVFKLLRKVDSTRWIGECNDRIGFILQSNIVNRILVQQIEVEDFIN